MKRFSTARVAALDRVKYLYIRAGAEHRFIFIWVVVVDGRVLVRPWNDRKTGWYRAFRSDPIGAVKIGAKQIAVRARSVRGTKLLKAMDEGYARKYTTKANKKYVKGFATAKRRATTLELIPA